MKLQSTEQIKVARQVLHDRWARDGEALPGLIWWDGWWWQWKKGEGWIKTDELTLTGLVLESLEDATYVAATITGDRGQVEEVEKRLAPTIAQVGGVVKTMQALVGWRGEVPAWRWGLAGVRADEVVAFEDVWVDVGQTVRTFKETGEYRWKVWKKTGRWWCPTHVKCKWDMKAKCPTWDRVLREWHRGDEDSIEGRLRYYGDCFRRVRLYARALFEFGLGRGGKGGGTRMLERLLGAVGYRGMRGSDFAGEFGMEDAGHANVIVVGELHDMLRREVVAMLGKVKTILGMDTTTENRKGVKIKQVRYQCNVVMQGNELPDVSDTHGAFLGKLVPIRFRHSWLGREDTGLERVLATEVQGAAMGMLKALVRLDASGGVFPTGEDSKEFVKRLREGMNLADDFLGRWFDKDDEHRGFVHMDLVRRARQEYEKLTGRVLKHKGGERVTDGWLLKWLEENSSWGLLRTREKHRRGVTGLRLKKTPDVTGLE